MMSAADIEWIANRFRDNTRESLRADHVAELLDEILTGMYSPPQLFEVFDKDRLTEVSGPIDFEELILDLESEVRSVVRRHQKD